MKKFLASHWPTIALNGVMIAAGVGVYLQNNEIVAQNPDAVALIGSVVAALNVVLRLFGMPVPQPPAKQ